MSLSEVSFSYFEKDHTVKTFFLELDQQTLLVITAANPSIEADMYLKINGWVPLFRQSILFLFDIQSPKA